MKFLSPLFKLIQPCGDFYWTILIFSKSGADESTCRIAASSTTKTGCHDIAEILLKVALNTINQIKSNQSFKAVLVMGFYELLGNPFT
jgi:hypothetical protein